MDNVLGSNDALSAVVTGLGVATIVAGVVVVVCAVFVVAERLRQRRTSGALAAPVTELRTAGGNTSDTGNARPALPVGAEAALQSIVELGGDPRNVVVTHRDPTGEIRLHPVPAADTNGPAATPRNLARSA